MSSPYAQATPQRSMRGSEDTEKTITPPPPPSVTFVSRTRDHLLETVRPSLLVEVELLILTFCTGIQDAMSFPEYHCFTSNQTGNTVLLTAALVLPELNGDAFYTANVAVALGLFLAGACLTGQLSHLAGPRRRVWLVLCNLLQTLLVVAAALVQQRSQQHSSSFSSSPSSSSASVKLTTTPPTGPASLVVIGLLALASGSQVVQSRSLGTTEIPTAMATAAYVDLLVDPRLVSPPRRGGETNRPRNRRLAFLACLIAGSLAGAGIYRTAGSAVALLVSAGGKAVVTGMYLFNGVEREKVEEAAV